MKRPLAQLNTPNAERMKVEFCVWKYTVPSRIPYTMKITGRYSIWTSWARLEAHTSKAKSRLRMPAFWCCLGEKKTISRLHMNVEAPYC